VKRSSLIKSVGIDKVLLQSLIIQYVEDVFWRG